MIDSYKSLLPDSAGNAVVLLAQISQQLNDLSNGTHVPNATPYTYLLRAQQSSPPTSAVWVNSLWFLSLVITLFCALLATLQQRWARRYIGLTQPHVAIHKRARIRSFFAEGVSRFHVHVAVEALSALVHISVFLFLAGLVISLFTIHHTVAYIILSATATCFLLYAAITVMPIICHDTPYTSPLSTLIWFITRKISLAVLNSIDFVADFPRKFKEKLAALVARWRPYAKVSATDTERGTKTDTVANTATNTEKTTKPPSKVSSYKLLLSGSITEAIYFSATRPDGERDARALGWVLDRLDEEGELVQFAAGIPGFSLSTEVKESVSILEMVPMSTELHEDLSGNIARLLLRAFMPGLQSDSKLLPESVRKQRVSICLEALYYLPHAFKDLLQSIVNHPRENEFKAMSSALLSVESWLLAERLSAATTSILDRDVKIGAQCVATVIASRPPPGEQSRTILMRHLRIEESLFNRYLEPFDNLLLKNLNSFLINTALDVIRDDDIQHHIDLVLLTVRFAKRLGFGYAALELRTQLDMLQVEIEQYKTASDEKTRDNATRLYSELSSLPPFGPTRPPASKAR